MCYSGDIRTCCYRAIVRACLQLGTPSPCPLPPRPPPPSTQARTRARTDTTRKHECADRSDRCAPSHTLSCPPRACMCLSGLLMVFSWSTHLQLPAVLDCIADQSPIRVTDQPSHKHAVSHGLMYQSATSRRNPQSSAFARYRAGVRAFTGGMALATRLC